MTIYAVIGGEHWVDFATNTGTGDFMRWADRLDEKEFPSIVHLSDWGWTNGLGTLQQEIRKAMKKKPPEEPLRKTLNLLLSNLKKHGKDAASIMLTDGLVPESENVGQWWNVEGDES